ncbi:MAG: precorrin-8X methylmutase [Thermodesulfobacteriota bacterium]
MTEKKQSQPGIGEKMIAPLIRQFYADPKTGEEIEALSLSVIDQEIPEPPFSPKEWQVVRRMIHTTADLTLINAARFSSRAVSAGVAALQKGSPIYCDSNMIRSGLSLARLRAVCACYSEEKIHCYVAHEEVVQESRKSGWPRSIFGIRKARPYLEGAIAVFGNAPLALLELNRMIKEEHVRPALVIAMPVGFVHVVESKGELMSLDIPYITLEGRRGGSPLAVSVIHALCVLAGLKSGKSF